MPCGTRQASEPSFLSLQQSVWHSQLGEHIVSVPLECAVPLVWGTTQRTTCVRKCTTPLHWTRPSVYSRPGTYALCWCLFKWDQHLFEGGVYSRKYGSLVKDHTRPGDHTRNTFCPIPMAHNYACPCVVVVTLASSMALTHTNISSLVLAWMG